eukprot:jgi/Chrzof1/2714/Cz11g26080.t1
MMDAVCNSYSAAYRQRRAGCFHGSHQKPQANNTQEQVDGACHMGYYSTPKLVNTLNSTCDNVANLESMVLQLAEVLHAHQQQQDSRDSNNRQAFVQLANRMHILEAALLPPTQNHQQAQLDPSQEHTAMQQT